MILISDIITSLQSLAPLAYQESYDNSGLHTGDSNMPVTSVLCTLDVTEQVVEEALQKGCNLIISHHPLIFKPLKSLAPKSSVEKTLLLAIKNNIALYAAHTNLDHVAGGVNFKLAQVLGLEKIEILAPLEGSLSKLVVFVPQSHTHTVCQALHAAGAGNIGQYEQCRFTIQGQGSFTPRLAANPYIGTAGVAETVTEDRVEMVLPTYLQGAVLNALRHSHPYEEIAYFLTPLANTDAYVGAGAVGYLKQPVAEKEFLNLIKKQLGIQQLRHTTLLKKEIYKVAVCGGAGIFLLPKAIKAGCTAFITADVKYHEFFPAQNNLLLADVGHYESEFYTKELFSEYLKEKFTNIAIFLSETNTNPVHYY